MSVQAARAPCLGPVVNLRVFGFRWGLRRHHPRGRRHHLWGRRHYRRHRRWHRCTIAGVTGSTGCTCGIGDMHVACQSASHASGGPSIPVSGPTAMTGTRSISQVTSRVSLVRPDDPRTLMEFLGCFRPLLREKHLSVMGSNLLAACTRLNPDCLDSRVLAGGSLPNYASYSEM